METELLAAINYYQIIQFTHTSYQNENFLLNRV